MKINLLLSALLLMGAILFTACEEDDDPTPQTPVKVTVADKVVADGELSTLLSALQLANLTDALNGDGPFTVFAPTNQAFQDLLDSNPAWNKLEDIEPAVLEAVLLYHVLPLEAKSTDLTDDYVPTLSMGPNMENVKMKVNVTGGVTFDGDVNPVAVDIDADNGVVHKVDKVLLPKNVVELAQGNNAFSILVQALTRSDIPSPNPYIALLSGTGPFTVFAPTDQAFINLLNSNPAWNTLADIPLATLQAVLEYHVVDGANVQSDELTDNQMVGTFGGSDLTVDLSMGAKLETTSGQSVNIIITDVQGTNGVVHAIDEVLIP